MFDVNYLGGHMPTFSLNFSRPGSEVVAQYFMFMSLGRDGYTAMMNSLRSIAMHISEGIAEIGPYRLISDGSELPVFAFTLAPEVNNYTVFDVSDRLRERGWLVPAYTFPENRQDLSVLRIVVRAGMHMEMADLLLDFLRDKTDALQTLTGPLPREGTVARRSRTDAADPAHGQVRNTDRRQISSPRRRPAASISASVEASSTCSRSRIRVPIRSSSRVPTTALHGTPAWRARVATSEMTLPARLCWSSLPSPVTTARAARIRASKPTASSTNAAPATSSAP